MEFRLFIGALNRETPYFQGARGDGLSVYAFDEEALTFRRLAHFPDIENPTYLSVTPDGRHVYANSEVAEWREGLVTAFSYESDTDRLDYLNTQPTLGSIAAHNMISRDGKRLYVANYAVGSGGPDQSLTVFDIRMDGTLSPAIASVAHRGSGPNPERQERSHAHSVTEILQGGRVIVADLGTDTLVTYRIATDGTPERLASTPTAPGAGPRHIALHPNGRFVFVMNELDSTVTAHALDPETGILTLIDSQPAVPDEARAHNHCSDIQISPDGRFLYGGNRGHDSIAVLEVSGTGTLTPRGFAPSGGATPRHLALTPTGRHLLVANQNADRVSILARDAETGALSDTGKFIPIGTPMCVKFAP
ncbi:lactonase family protein [Paracoccus ravus]|uniref:lactonase family protein n=1 Tax=Paracoccus ravus TaxID=2447760 RepID=UPI00106E7B1B|nr:lactonase family protein [Paracoccus ravus]